MELLGFWMICLLLFRWILDPCGKMKPAILAAGLVFGACATATLAVPDADKEAKRFAAPPDAARVYVTRPGTQGGAGVVQVIIDGGVIGSLAIRTYLYSDVKSGDHALSVGGPGGVRVVPIHVESGHCYFYRIRDWGLFRQDTDEQGRDAVLNSSLIQMSVR